MQCTCMVAYVYVRVVAIGHVREEEESQEGRTKEEKRIERRGDDVISTKSQHGNGTACTYGYSLSKCHSNWKEERGYAFVHT